MAKRRIDFDDETAVLKEVAKAINVSWDQLKIRESRNYQELAESTIYEIGRAWSHNEWYVVENDEAADALATTIVEQDLEESPENFNQDFIENHIDTKKLKKDLMSDVTDMRIEDLTDEAERRPDDFWQQYEGEGWTAPEEDEEGERRAPTSREIEELAERLAEEQLSDPMAWLEEIYGREDAVKKAIEIAGLNVKEAAEAAIREDGAGHFLSSYDNETHETPTGLVYWRGN